MIDAIAKVVRCDSLTEDEAAAAFEVIIRGDATPSQIAGFLVALPSFGIDMSLPALTATSAAFAVAPAQVSLMMSLFMLACE